MACGFHDLGVIVANDTWDGQGFQLTSDSGELDDSLDSVRMYFRLAGASTNALTLTSDDEEITITDAAGWAFTVEPVEPFNLAAGTYSWAIETADTAGRVKTYLMGTIRVVADALT